MGRPAWEDSLVAFHPVRTIVESEEPVGDDLGMDRPPRRPTPSFASARTLSLSKTPRVTVGRRGRRAGRAPPRPPPVMPIAARVHAPVPSDRLLRQRSARSTASLGT